MKPDQEKAAGMRAAWIGRDYRNLTPQQRQQIRAAARRIRAEARA